MAYTWKPEWFVENLFESLQYGRDGNIEIVAHNANFDQKVFEKLFKDHDYPFFWNDKDKEKFNEAYFNKYPNQWYHGDYAKITLNKGFIIYVVLMLL